jgi:hypothetical protein
MKIEVTQEDIDKARTLVKSNTISITKCCPIALAARRTTKNKCVAAGNFIRIYKGKRINVHNIPPSAQIFMNNFDDNRPVEPFEFETKYRNSYNK